MLICPICKSLSISNKWKINNYNLKKCLSCTYQFIIPRPTTYQINQFYKEFDYKDLYKSEQRIRNDAKKSISFIRSYINKQGSILDVGCGRGYFLDELRLQGWNNIKGIDYSNKVINYARKNLLLDVKVSDFINYRESQKFDLIILNQVLEHIIDVDLFISQILFYLKKRGYLYIATPNISSASAKVFKKEFEHLIPPEHINYFNIRSLNLLLFNKGFKVINKSTWGYPENLAGIIKKIINKKSRTDTNISAYKNNKTNTLGLSYLAKFKYNLFDRFFCSFFYKFLDIAGLGINLQVLAQKK